MSRSRFRRRNRRFRRRRSGRLDRREMWVAKNLEVMGLKEIMAPEEVMRMVMVVMLEKTLETTVRVAQTKGTVKEVMATMMETELVAMKKSSPVRRCALPGV